LQASHNYHERGMQTYLLTANLDDRAGQGRIESRIGIGVDADTFKPADDLFARIKTRLAEGEIACVFIDEAQFLSPDQVWQLARAVDDLDVPIMCYGLRVDFRGELFPGSADARSPNHLPLREKGHHGGASGWRWQRPERRRAGANWRQ